MVQALKQRITIGAGGRVQIDKSDLPEGRSAEVIVFLDEPATTTRAMSTLLGACQGQFAFPAEADAHLREIRDEWERP